MWLTLFWLNNCFNDGSKKHLGLKYKGDWYALTHLDNGTGVRVYKRYLKMRHRSNKKNYLKRIHNSAPNLVEETGFEIHYILLEQYDEKKRDNLKNKQKQYHGRKSSTDSRSKNRKTITL